MGEKRGQFFILAAVIIAVAIVGLTVVYNTVNIGDSPKRFYSYSIQFDTETGAVVDYSLYNNKPTKVQEFINNSVEAVLDTYPDFDIFACYTGTSKEILVCDNYGGYDILIFTTTDEIFIPRGKTAISTSLDGNIGIEDRINTHETANVYLMPEDTNLTVQSGGVNYTIDLTKATSSSNSYYFIFRTNTSAGSYAAQS